MAKSDRPKDLFMNFATVEATWPAVTTVLTEQRHGTGLTIRGGDMWIIHMIEFHMVIPFVSASIAKLVLSTVKGAATIPNAGDKGFIAGASLEYFLNTNGGGILKQPDVQHLLPPMPLASPNVSLYIVSEADDAALDGQTVYARIGYTTVPMDPKAYLEIAETWAQV